MKVYLATSGEYSDYGVRRVFARREDAEAYPLASDVEEFDLDEGPVEVRIEHRLYWYSWIEEREATDGKPGNPWTGEELMDFDGQPHRAEHQWIGPKEQTLLIKGWDLDRVQKVYSEQRAQFIAKRDMGVEQ